MQHSKILKEDSHGLKEHLRNLKKNMKRYFLESGI
jgi:hypothetical protein